MKYWEIIADNLSREGWSCGHISYFDNDGRRMVVAEAYREDRGRFIVHADDILTAFHEVRSQCGQTEKS